MISNVLFFLLCDLLSDFVEKMSLFKYFQRKEIPKEESLTAAYESLKGNPPECITVEEIESVQKILQNKKLYVFGEKEKQEIAKFEVAAAVRKFKKKFPTLTESTIHLGSRDTKKI